MPPAADEGFGKPQQEHFDAAQRVINQLTAFGSQLSLDDFGTAFSCVDCAVRVAAADRYAERKRLQRRDQAPLY